MKILALETSTQRGGAALIINGSVIATRTSDRQRSHSELLHVFVNECLKARALKISDIDAFAVGQGPGSFTGIRVAANTGKTYASATDKNLVSVNSLELLALQVQDRTRPIVSILNAFKNLVYYATYEFAANDELIEIRGPSVGTMEELDSIIVQPTTAIGDGYSVYKDFFPPSLAKNLVRETNSRDFPEPGTLGLRAENLVLQGRVFDWKSFVPLYLRASEAEENRRGVLFKPLVAKDPADGKTR
jgi:N6-L-threonylcarbamoyladenine synthase/tRNA threonylcarbamoyladenosine biosynthesis protein TsaB